MSFFSKALPTAQKAAATITKQSKQTSSASEDQPQILSNPTDAPSIDMSECGVESAMNRALPSMGHEPHHAIYTNATHAEAMSSNVPASAASSSVHTTSADEKEMEEPHDEPKKSTKERVDSLENVMTQFVKSVQLSINSNAETQAEMKTLVKSNSELIKKKYKEVAKEIDSLKQRTDVIEANESGRNRKYHRVNNKLDRANARIETNRKAIDNVESGVVHNHIVLTALQQGVIELAKELAGVKNLIESAGGNVGKNQQESNANLKQMENKYNGIKVKIDQIDGKVKKNKDQIENNGKTARMEMDYVRNNISQKGQAIEDIDEKHTRNFSHMTHVPDTDLSLSVQQDIDDEISKKENEMALQGKTMSEAQKQTIRNRVRTRNGYGI